MPNLHDAICSIIEIADNDAHGYSQAHRYGPDYDCSSSVAKALRDGGWDCPVTSTTSTLPNWLKSHGWVETSDPRCLGGDIYCTEGKHVVMSFYDGWVVTASGDKDGKTGDSSGKEIYKRLFYTPSYGWKHHLRYSGSYTDSSTKYEVGKTYTVQVDHLNIRKGAGTNFQIKSKSELTANAQKVTNAKGQLMRGCRVTCKAYVNGWMEIPSGWIYTNPNGKAYVS